MTVVAVIIPYYQREKGILKKALDSIALQKLPSDVILKIVVIDDESPLPVADALEGFAPQQPHELILLKRSNGGPGAARNTGIDFVAGAVDYIAFLDSDDIWFEHHIAEALLALKSGVDFYFTNTALNGSDSFSHWRYIAKHHGSAPNYREAVRTISGREGAGAIVEECIPHASQVVYDPNIKRDLRFDPTFRQACEDQLFFLDLSSACRKIGYTTHLGGARGKGISLYDRTLSWDSVDAPNRLIDELRFVRKAVYDSRFGAFKKLSIVYRCLFKVHHLMFLIIRHSKKHSDISIAAIKKIKRELPELIFYLPLIGVFLPVHYFRLKRGLTAVESFDV